MFVFELVTMTSVSLSRIIKFENEFLYGQKTNSLHSKQSCENWSINALKIADKEVYADKENKLTISKSIT